jgi:alkanesulfonate monooxygenase SsuD/methylene tetrahydromethanopterin reductase-like flavin-dependent oxidoreductase (luciferase family)
VEGSPRPYGAHDPFMMNAGSSPAGCRFAIRHPELHFDGITTPKARIDRGAKTKRLARERGCDIQVWTPVGLACLVLNVVDSLTELPYVAQEILPRLERLVLRAAATRQRTIWL